MLSSIAKMSGKILVMLMVGMLILSFAVWGIGDVFRGGSSNAIATVGDSEISEQEFRNELGREIEQMRAYFGNALDPELIASMRIERRVLERMINQRLLSLEANNLGVWIGDQTALKEISSSEAFRNELGMFDADAFSRYLFSRGETEQSFVAKLKTQIASQLLFDSLTAESIVPDIMADYLYAYQNEKRRGTLVIINKDYVTEVPEPQDSELIEYYEKEKQTFAAPEYRDVSYIILDRKTLADNVDVREEELKEIYEANIDEYVVQEKRTLLHMVFDSKEEASEAYKKLESGDDFLRIAREDAGQDESTTRFVETTKNDLIEAIAERSFTLEQEKYSEIIESDLGFHIVQTENIIPQTTQSFEDVKERISKERIAERLDDLMYNTVNELDDAFAAGATLEEAAEIISATVQSVRGLTSIGEIKENNDDVSLPDFSDFTSTAFSLSEKEISQVIANENNDAYYAVHVDAIMPARIKALDEVKGLVIEAWKVDKKNEIASTLANTLAASINTTPIINIKNIKAIIGRDSEAVNNFNVKVKSDGIRIKSFEPTTRNPEALDEDLSPELLVDLFVLPKDKATNAYRNSKGDYIVARLDDIIPVSTSGANNEMKSETKSALAYAFVDDASQQYISYLRLQYPVNIFEEKLQTLERQP